MKRNCRVCTNSYDYCHFCAISKDTFKNAGYCGEDCYHISMILQRYRGRAAADQNTIETLKSYNIEFKELRPSFKARFKHLLDSFSKEVIPQEDVEVVIEYDKDMTISENE